MSIVMHYVDQLHEMLDRHADKRTTDWLLMSSPFPTLFICLTYIYAVKVIGPKLMENRKPFQLTNVLIVYNILQVMFSAWLFHEIGMSGWLTGEYSLRCQPVDYSDRPQVLRMVRVSWWYYFSKFTEFMDTIFFVLRKKNDHVSTLHVIHHGCMPMSVWFGVKFTPGGHSTFFGLINTFVHVVMYTYYLLSALGPKVQPYLWWKKYLTAFQMLQFIAIMTHAFQLLFIDCNYPKAFVWWIGMHAVMFFFLFNEFYQQSYAQKTKRASALAAKAAEAAAAAKALAATSALSSSIVGNGNGGIANGKLTNGTTTEALTNGAAKRHEAAADYYVKGESIAASELHLRKAAAAAAAAAASD